MSAATAPGPARAADWLPRGAFVVALVAISAWVAVRRWPAFGPPSLWLDDQWAALAATRMDLASYIEFRPPLPLGFYIVERALVLLLGISETTLQLFPLACSILVVPVTGILVQRLTGSRALGLLGACLLAANSWLALFATNVKPFSSDALAVVCVLLVGERVFTRPGSARYALLAAVGFVALTVSFSSVLASFALMAIFFLTALLRRDRAVRGLALVLVLYVLAVAAFYLVMLRDSTNYFLRAYWHAYFAPPLGEGFFAFLAVRGWAAISTALPSGWAWLSLVLPPGLVAMAIRAESRWAALFFLAFAAECVALSALRLYPLGGGRTDIFTLPVTVAAVCASIAAVAARVPANALVVRVSRAGTVLLALVLLWTTPTSSYFPNNDAALVRRLAEAREESDLVVLNGHAGVAASYYGPWPVIIGRSSRIDKIPQIDRPHVLSLHWPAFDADSADELTAKVDHALERRPERIFYLATHLTGPDAAVDARIRSTITDRGYQVHEEVRVFLARLLVFTRAD